MAGLLTSPEAAPTRSGIACRTLGVALLASAFSLCLFGECQTVRISGALGNIVGEVAATLTDSGTQWMVFLCAGLYCFALTVLRERLGGKGGGGDDGRWKMHGRGPFTGYGCVGAGWCREGCVNCCLAQSVWPD